jgi:hypothetical protein
MMQMTGFCRSSFQEREIKDRVEFVENGVERIDFLFNIHDKKIDQDRYPGFILLDLICQKKTGLNNLKKLSNIRFLKETRTLYLPQPKRNDIKRCYNPRANNYVVEPVSFDGLIKVIEDI